MSPYPSRLRWIVTLTLMVNVILLAVRMVILVRVVNPQGRYETYAGSSLPGTSVIAKHILGHVVPMVILAAIGVLIWSGHESGAAVVYAILTLILVPFIGARYMGREAAGYSVSGTAYGLTAVWLVACGITALSFVRRLARFERSGRAAVMDAIVRSE